MIAPWFLICPKISLSQKKASYSRLWIWVMWRFSDTSMCKTMFLNHDDMGVNPKIMVPPNHPFVHRVFHEINHPFWGVKSPYFWFNTYIWYRLFHVFIMWTFNVFFEDLVISERLLVRFAHAAQMIKMGPTVGSSPTSSPGTRKSRIEVRKDCWNICWREFFSFLVKTGKPLKSNMEGWKYLLGKGDISTNYRCFFGVPVVSCHVFFVEDIDQKNAFGVGVLIDSWRAYIVKNMMVFQIIVVNRL